MNDNKNKIIREEFARAMMIKKAQSVLSESAFRGFIHEMRKYEQNMIITESMSSESIYDGFQKQLQEQTAEVGKEGEIIANEYGEGEGNITADAVKKPPTGDGGDGDDKGEGDEKKSAEIKKFMDRLSPDTKEKLKALRISDPVKAARYIMKNPDQFESNEEMEADAFIRSETARVTGKDPGSSFDAPEKPTGDVKKDTENLGKELESPKAKGILSSIFNSYKFAFAANAKMWEKIYSFIAGIGDKPPAQQAQAAQQAEDELETAMPDPPDSPEEAEEQAEEGGEGGDESINIRKGKNSLQSRISKLFPDLAKAKGTYYYRRTDKEGDQGKIISKNTSALAAILGDIEAQLKGSGIAITESLRAELVDAIGTLYVMQTNGLLMERSDYAKFRTNLQVALQRVTRMHEDPKKKRKAIQKFLYRLKRYAQDGDFSQLAGKKEYQGRTEVPDNRGKTQPVNTPIAKLGQLYAEMSPEDQEKAKAKAIDYANNQINQQEKRDDPNNPEFKATTLGNARKDAPTKTRHQMAQQVPKIKSGVVNIAQIVGPKLKAAGYDLKSPEGQKVQQRLLKVLRRFLKKDLERLGLSNKVKLLAMFSKSKPKKKGKVNESMESLEESYLDFFSNYMLEGIINELSNQ